ncbi:hypothetical protein ACVIWV_009334 [Bradyrhizobium diazoefficiens]
MMGRLARSVATGAGARSARQQYAARHDVSGATQVRDRSRRPVQVIRILLASTIGEQSIVSENAEASESKANSFSASPGKRYSFVDAKCGVCCCAAATSLASMYPHAKTTLAHDYAMEERETVSGETLFCANRPCERKRTARCFRHVDPSRTKLATSPRRRSRRQSRMALGFHVVEGRAWTKKVCAEHAGS